MQSQTLETASEKNSQFRSQREEGKSRRLSVSDSGIQQETAPDTRTAKTDGGVGSRAPTKAVVGIEPLEEAKGEAKSVRLLVVDDNPHNLLVISRLSQFLGYEAKSVSNGPEAIEAMRDDAFDIVLMDVRMAPITGIETTQKIRAGEAGARCSDTYIIAVTAHAMQEDRQKCLSSGMDDYLPKPITLDRLKNSLNRARESLSLD